MTANVTKLGPLGPYDNNAYVIVDAATKRSIVVDAPIGSEAAVEAARGTEVLMIIVTHRHRDHWAEIDVLKEQLAAPVFCHEGDRAPYAEKVFDTLGDGADIPLGESVVRRARTRTALGSVSPGSNVYLLSPSGIYARPKTTSDCSNTTPCPRTGLAAA